MRIPDSKRPPERTVGARIKIVPDFQSKVEALFRNAGVTPIHKELISGSVSYWFSKKDMPALVESKALELIPQDHWADVMIAGTPPIFN